LRFLFGWCGEIISTPIVASSASSGSLS